MAIRVKYRVRSPFVFFSSPSLHKIQALACSSLIYSQNENVKDIDINLTLNILYDFMHIISRKTLLEFAQKHADAFAPLDDWYRIAKVAQWKNLIEVRQFYPSADAVGNFTVFNIKGNDYRLIVSIDYQRLIIYVKYTLTHAEYDTGKWKDDPHF